MTTMADIMRRYGNAYRARYGNRMLPSHKRAMRDIVRCRTQAMGGKVYECPEHHEVAYKYYSCMNRSCPKCQNDQAQAWLAKERNRLIAVPYFLLTFTLPKQLRTLARSNQKLLFNLMFAAAWKATKKLARDPRLLGGLIGALAVLHTWTRMLIYHPHIHFLVPAGAISDDYTVWLPAQRKFFLPVRAVSKMYRAMLRDALKQANLKLFNTIPKQVWYKDWVVHCKPAGNGESVLKYFAPYIYRVAISNRRIVKVENDRVTFVYKHPETKQWKPVTLPVMEFMRRLLQHVLPRGFKKVRHFGFLSSKYKHVLKTVQYILGTVEDDKPDEDTEHKSGRPCCPICGKEMILIGLLKPEYYGQIEPQDVPP